MCQNSASEVPRQGFGTFWCTYKLPLYAKHETKYLEGRKLKILKTVHWKPVGIYLLKKSSQNNKFGM